MVSIGLAVLGAGHQSAHILVSSLLKHKCNEHPLFDIVAVWDPDQSRAVSFAEAFGHPTSVCCSKADTALTKPNVIVAIICGASPATQPALAAKVWLCFC